MISNRPIELLVRNRVLVIAAFLLLRAKRFMLVDAGKLRWCLAPRQVEPSASDSSTTMTRSGRY